MMLSPSLIYLPNLDSNDRARDLPRLLARGLPKFLAQSRAADLTIHGNETSMLSAKRCLFAMLI